eukprot:792764-Prymnesium_polylepis.1
MQREVGGALSLPSTLLFEAPTIRQLVCFFDSATPLPTSNSAAVPSDCRTSCVEMGADKIAHMVESHVGHN